MDETMDAPARFPEPWVSVPDQPWPQEHTPPVLIREGLWVIELEQPESIWDAPLPGLLN